MSGAEDDWRDGVEPGCAAVAVPDYRAAFIEAQVARGISRESAERAAEHMTAGRIVPDTIEDAAVRDLAWKMVKESRWPA